MSYTKKELFEAFADLDEDALIKINIINEIKDGGGSEAGREYEIESLAISGTTEGLVVGYDID